jgi:hypothetical protein
MARRSVSIPEGGVTSDWLLERLGFDPASFWKDSDARRYLDTQVAVETVAVAHADTGFPLFLPVWDEIHDLECDGKSFTGRLIAAAMQREGHDWPLDRSWFHELYIDLARLDGALGVDLSSEGQLRHAVESYWKRIGVLARTHAATIRLDRTLDSELAEMNSESFKPLKQLTLF